MARVRRWSGAHEGVGFEVSLSEDATGGERLEVIAQTEEAGVHALERLLAALRHASSNAELSPRGIEPAFRVEDLVEVEARVPGVDGARAERWLRRRLANETVVHARDAEGVGRLAASFARRGALPTSQRARYERAGGRVRVEAFELHVVEHCNLRCAHCCNMSPYLAERTLSVDEVDEMCRTMAAHLEVDVFKIMGGEPLLHPDIAAVLDAIRRSGISGKIRLFTNGLLLHAMGDDFWRALDELTISSYASAKVKPAHLEAAREKARAFDVVLNVKPVAEFSEVMKGRREDDGRAVKRTYEQCWLRHRCMVVRGGKFFTCTRAAYAEEFHRDVLKGAYPEDLRRARESDGVPITHARFGEALLAYLNRGEPLASCRFCHGGEGPRVPHAQLSKSDVREGRLVPLRLAR